MTERHHDADGGQLVAAEIYFPSPEQMTAGLAALREEGWETRIFDWVDPCDAGTRVVLAWTIASENFKGHEDVQNIVEEFLGDANEVGPVTDAELAAWKSRRQS